VTLSDVATAAGVSKATVSKVLNGRDDVSSSTRERIRQVLAELDYRLPTAPGLAGGRPALALVFDVPASPYVLGVVQGAMRAATEAKVDLLVRLAPPRPARTDRAQAKIWLAEQRASGVVGIVAITLSGPDALIDAASEVSVPFVIIDPVDTRHRKMVSVGSSNWAGARSAAEHLLGLGHRRIAWIGGPEASDAARDRLYGYQAALDVAGIEIDPALIRSGSFEVGAGAARAEELLSLDPPPTAIMAADDEIAVGVLATAHALGIRVPEELSVVGVDDTPQAAWTTPPLTTVHQHLEGMGEVAVQTVLAMAEGRSPASRHVELATSLTVRSSTAPPPRGR
jgi:LacI family transcriptional regulator